jgi:tetratricopeptide (TPR) repeat protein
MNTKIKNLIIYFLIIFTHFICAQTNSEYINNRQKSEVISLVKQKLIERYVDLNKAKKTSEIIIDNLKSGSYNSIENPNEFAKRLTNDVQLVSKDLHLKIRFEPKRITKLKQQVSKDDSIQLHRRRIKSMAKTNFGFNEVKILKGNIGYLDIKYFADARYAKETLDASMLFLKNTNAIIIDLRENKGGVPSTLKLLASYFYEETPVLLSRFYNRSTDKTEEFWTAAAINGKRLPKTKLYILTSKATFSAAEAFAYTLKHLKRATVVGEITKGGANRAKRITINNHFTISIPYIKAIHPITKTNWEGVGVIPDVQVSARDSFVTAYINAINTTINISEKKNRIMNNIGYTFLEENAIDYAIKIFETNVKMFPQDANLWDSLGEAYLKNGDKKKAMKTYKKALSINPDLSSALKMIKKLGDK